MLKALFGTGLFQRSAVRQHATCRSALLSLTGRGLRFQHYGETRRDMLRSAEKRSTASVLRAEQRGGKDDILAPPGGRRADGEAAAVTSGLTAAPTKSFLSNKTFVDMRLAPPVVAALKSVGISRVSAIQELALPTILSGRTALVGAETGSGKTLLYTLPIAQLAFRISNAAAKAAVNPTPAEAVGGDAASQPGAVALMLLPNQELVLQSAAVLRMITQGLPCRIIPLSSGIPAELPPAAGPAPGWLTVYAATPAAFVNFADKARRAAAAPAAPAVGAPQAAAFVESTAAPLDGSAAASGSEPAPALPTSKAAARRARSAAAAAAAAVAHDVVPGLSPAVIVALDEADLLASPTHRSSVERALIAVGAARLLDDSDAPAKAAGSSTAATASTASTSKAKASSTSRPGAGSASADESLERAAGAGAASASGPGGRRLVLLPTTQVIATAATLLEPLRTSGASLQDGFGAWLHRHMRDAAIIRSPGLHRPTSLVRVRHVFVRDADIVEGLQLHDRDVDADERKLGPGQRAGASADASDSSTAAAAGGAEGVTSGSGSAETDWEEVLAARRASALLRAVRLTVPERLAATADSKTAAFPPASDATLADGSAAEPLLEEADAAMNATAPTAANNVKPQQRGKPQAAAETDGGAAERDSDRGQVLVFVNDALTADEVAGALQALAPDLTVESLHKTVTATARAAIVSAWFEGRIDVVVATDLAGRGLDTTHVGHVINYDLPVDLASYLHRIGRTARAGAKGIVTNLSLASQKEYIRSLHELAEDGRPDSLQQRHNASMKARRLGSVKRLRSDGSPAGVSR